MTSCNLNYPFKGPISQSVILGVRNSASEFLIIHNSYCNKGYKDKSKRDTQFDGLIGLMAVSILINKVKNVNSACKSLGKKDTVLGPSRKGSLWGLCLILVCGAMNLIVRKEGSWGIEARCVANGSEHVSMRTGKLWVMKLKGYFREC